MILVDYYTITLATRTPLNVFCTSNFGTTKNTQQLQQRLQMVVKGAAASGVASSIRLYVLRLWYDKMCTRLVPP